MRTHFLIGLCFLLTTTGFAQKFDLGEINGAKYLIYIPDNWNQGLIMYAHGYEGIGEETWGFEEEVNEFMEIFTSRGFAYAASAYKRQGMVIKDGIDDTEALRSYFEFRYGKPELSIITGHSMGGIISLATIEKLPAEYDGALPLCGWLAPVHSLIKNGLEMLVTYDYLFGGNNGDIVTGEEIIEAEQIEERLSQNPEMVKLYAEHFRIKEAQLADMIEFYQSVSKETTAWLGGLPFGNTQTIYSGFGDNDKSLNKNILRYTPDPEAQEYVIRYYTPTGRISDPVLALHTTYDEILPVYNYKYYEEITEINHTSDLYVQQYIVRDGHCAFENQEIGNALDQLLLWIREGKRPENKYR